MAPTFVVGDRVKYNEAYLGVVLLNTPEMRAVVGTVIEVFANHHLNPNKCVCHVRWDEPSLNKVNNNHSRIHSYWLRRA